MTDLDKALDAAREALSEYDAYGMPIDAGSIRDLLAALDAQVPDGYALVPVEPTEAMLDAGHAAAWRRIPSCFDMTDAEIVYRAMLAAALAQRKEIAAINAEPAAAKNPKEK